MARGDVNGAGPDIKALRYWGGNMGRARKCRHRLRHKELSGQLFWFNLAESMSL